MSKPLKFIRAKAKANLTINFVCQAASNLDTICPFCGFDFNRTVRQVAEFAIGLFFACLFTFQLFPILVSPTVLNSDQIQTTVLYT